MVVEAGAIDTPACASAPAYEVTLMTCLNYWGYYVFDGQQTKIWQGELQFILEDLNNVQHISAKRGTNPQYNYLEGKWDWDLNFRTTYLWPYLCYESACQ